MQSSANPVPWPSKYIQNPVTSQPLLRYCPSFLIWIQRLTPFPLLSPVSLVSARIEPFKNSTSCPSQSCPVLSHLAQSSWVITMTWASAFQTYLPPLHLLCLLLLQLWPPCCSWNFSELLPWLFPLSGMFSQISTRFLLEPVQCHIIRETSDLLYKITSPNLHPPCSPSPALFLPITTSYYIFNSLLPFSPNAV